MSGTETRDEPSATSSDDDLRDRAWTPEPVGTVIGPRVRRSAHAVRRAAGLASPHRPVLARIHRLAAGSGGRLTVSVHAGLIETAVLECLDRAGVRLSSALAGDVGGRLSLRLLGHVDTVTLEIHTARPGSWTRALHRSSFDHLLTDVSTGVASLGGTLAISEEPFGRLLVVIRFNRPPTAVR